MRILFAGALLCSLSLAGCDALDTKEDLNLTDEMMATRRYQMFDWGYRVYEHIPYGFTAIDGNLFAAVSDEAQYVTTFSSTQRFNEGSWSAYYNPDDCYTSYYNGIYAAHDYLDKSVDYRYILGMHRDTLTSNGLDSYRRDIVDVQRLRAEAHVLKAYYYFELAKRYGGVPLIDRVYADQKEANLPRGTFDEVVGLILREIEGVRNELVVDWRAENLDEKSGRITRGAALALKSRVLLYAASPQFNPSGEKSKWAAAAAAAFEVINMGIYSLHPDYGGLFVAETSTTSPETIWAVRMGATNEFERKNYPIGTQGGGTGICPSQNLVEAYESTGEDTGDAYAGLDPRFYATVLRNGDTWNGRTLEIYAGGADDPARQNASPTGYYLRKFLNENLNLTNDDKRLRSWIVFRYAEILLNFAEAMNEAYGPDDAHGYGMSARDAVDAVRARSGVGMPPVDVAPGDAAALRPELPAELPQRAVEPHGVEERGVERDLAQPQPLALCGVGDAVTGQELVAPHAEILCRILLLGERIARLAQCGHIGQRIGAPRVGQRAVEVEQDESDLHDGLLFPGQFVTAGDQRGDFPEGYAAVQPYGEPRAFVHMVTGEIMFEVQRPRHGLRIGPDVENLCPLLVREAEFAGLHRQYHGIPFGVVLPPENGVVREFLPEELRFAAP